LGKHLKINIKIIKKRLAAIRRNKLVMSDGVASKILKLGGETMIPYFARCLNLTINNATISSDWKRATVVPIYNGGDG
jgi:hypothetical protein